MLNLELDKEGNIYSLEVRSQILFINYKKKLRNQTVVNQMIKINLYQ